MVSPIAGAIKCPRGAAHTASRFSPILAALFGGPVMRLLQVAVVLVAAGSGGLMFFKTVVDLPDAPRRLDAADLDGDGDVDLFVIADAAGNAASLRVLLNDGGQFSPGWNATQTAGAQSLPWDVDLADTDDDGDVDVFAVRPPGAPFQRLNDGSGGFDDLEDVPSFAGRAEQEPVDMDDDGDTDLVYYEEDFVGYFGTLEGFGDSTYEFDLSTEVWGLAQPDLARRFELGDINGDGLKDAAMASIDGLHFIPTGPHPSGGTLPCFLDNQHQKIFATSCADVALADLDGNGLLDILATVPSIHAVVVYLSQGGGGFTGPTFSPAGASPAAMTTTDMDLDGHADVIVTNPTTGRVNVLLGAGDGTLGAPEDFRVGQRPIDIVAADFDDDGDPDLAVACSIGGHVTVLLNNSALPHAVIGGWR